MILDEYLKKIQSLKGNKVKPTAKKYGVCYSQLWRSVHGLNKPSFLTMYKLEKGGFFDDLDCIKTKRQYTERR